ncbi:hypothetical protein VOLCADRAFT_117640, partial [Volvox carteri f. nagariensis]
NWNCPICMDLLYKPCINNCGHTFCFWCMHNSMNPFRPSQCPLCRAAYTHFPRVCVPLHYFLASSFPEQYSERERENRGKVKRPCILSCGCVVCRSCLPGTPRASRGTRAQGAAVAAVAAAAGHLITSPTGPGASPPPQQQQQRSSREHPEQQQQQQQGVCGHLDPDTDGLGKLPRTLPRREGSASPPASPPRQRQPGRQQKMEDEGYHHDQQPRQQQEQGRIIDIWLALREEMAAQADKCFTWYSVGCDDCGMFPIIGRRYRCVECTEVVGYDLCGACYDRGAAGRGRFNQLHRPEHRVVKVEPCFGQVAPAEARRGGAAATASAAGGAVASASAAERVDGGGGNGGGGGSDGAGVGDRPGVAVLEGLQLLTLMNYLEVLHPELTVEQATTLVIMHLGAPGGLLDLAEAGLRGGGGGGGGAVGRGGVRGAPAARSSHTNVAGGTSSSSSSSSAAAGSRGLSFRWGLWSFSSGRSGGGTGGAGDGAADAASSGTVVDGSGGRRFGGDGGGGSGLPWFAWASRRRGGGGGDADLSLRQRAFTGLQDVVRRNNAEQQDTPQQEQQAQRLLGAPSDNNGDVTQDRETRQRNSSSNNNNISNNNNSSSSSRNSCCVQ